MAFGDIPLRGAIMPQGLMLEKKVEMSIGHMSPHVEGLLLLMPPVPVLLRMSRAVLSEFPSWLPWQLCFHLVGELLLIADDIGHLQVILTALLLAISFPPSVNGHSAPRASSLALHWP